MTCTANVAALTGPFPKSIGANDASLNFPTCFTNPPVTAFQNSNWTTGLVTYISATSNNNAILKSVDSFRDAEVVTWTRQGYIFLRVDGNGSGIFFNVNLEATNSAIEIGIVTGLNESSFPSGTYYTIYTMDNMVGSIPNYSKTLTENQTFTFGVSGYEIYAKFNDGTHGDYEFVRFKDYRVMNSGQMWIKSLGSSGYGFRTLSFSQTTAPTLYSNGTPLQTTSAGNQAATQLDVRDLGCRAQATAVGSVNIGVSANTLNLVSNPGFIVDDWIIVEIGGESGGGLRGSLGVGGSWPRLYYANAAAMNADTGQVNYTYAWLLDTGLCYWWTGSIGYDLGIISGCTVTSGSTQVDTINAGFHFVPVGTTMSGTGIVPGTKVATVDSFTRLHMDTPASGNGANVDIQFNVPTNTWTHVGMEETHVYYGSKGVPRALQARITAIGGGGLTLTLSANATVSTTNARVLLDNLQWINYHIGTWPGSQIPISPAAVTLSFPPGDFSIGGQIKANGMAGTTIKGSGQAFTTLYVPDGTRGASISGQNCDGIIVRDFTIRSNLGLNGFGLAWSGSLTPDYASNGLVKNGNGRINVHFDTDEAVLGETFTGVPLSGEFICEGISFTANDFIVQDITAYDIMTNVVACHFGGNSWARRVTAYVTEQEQTYIQWQFDWVNAVGGGFDSCVLISSYLCPGFESFNSHGTNFLNCSGVNVGISLNQAGAFVIRDCRFSVKAMSLAPVWSVGNPMIGVSTNTGSGTSEYLFGGIVDGLTINIEGYIDVDNNVPGGVFVGGTNANGTSQNISLNRFTYTAPDYAAPGLIGGAVGILSQGLNVNVSCTTVNGVAGNGYTNIMLDDGSLKYSRFLTKTVGAGVILVGNGLPSDPQSPVCSASTPSQRMGSFEMTF